MRGACGSCSGSTAKDTTVTGGDCVAEHAGAFASEENLLASRGRAAIQAGVRPPRRCVPTWASTSPCVRSCKGGPLSQVQSGVRWYRIRPWSASTVHPTVQCAQMVQPLSAYSPTLVITVWWQDSYVQRLQVHCCMHAKGASMGNDARMHGGTKQHGPGCALGRPNTSTTPKLRDKLGHGKRREPLASYTYGMRELKTGQHARQNACSVFPCGQAQWEGGDGAFSSTANP